MTHNHGLDRVADADWLERDYGDDLVYAAESVLTETNAVLRNVKRATPTDKFTALQHLRDALALLNDAITECEL